MRNFYKFTFILLFSVCAHAQVPTATIISVAPAFCTETPIFFAARSSNGPTSFAWSCVPARATFISGANDSLLMCSFAGAGTYVLNVTVSNSSGTTVSSRTISVIRSANASFNASMATTGYPNQLSLTDYSTNKLKNYWLFSDEATRDSSSYFVKNYTGSGSFTVTQVAIGRSGCNDTLAYTFRISDSSSVKLPNVFTPNNDEVNDVFKPITRGIVKLNAWVYNRYGILIYSWDRVNGYWDGHTTSGLECRAGEYFVVLEATGFDGVTYKLKSTVTLIK